MVSTFSSSIRRREMDAVLTCLVDEKIGPGEMNARLCQSVKEFFAVAGSVAFRNCEIALSYAVRALGIEKGARVLVSALAPSWHYTSVEKIGLVPVVLDVDEDTSLVSLDSMKAAMEGGAAALIFHESLGILPSAEVFREILESGIFVIEDVSQSVGSEIDLTSVESDSADGVAETSGGDEESGKNPNARRAGSFGVFSIMGLEEGDTVTGGGGAVLMASNKREWTTLRNITEKAARTEILPDINSALAFVQLKEFSRNEAARKVLFSSYKKAVSVRDRKNRTFSRGIGSQSTVWSFPVVLNGSFPDALQYAKKKEIEIVRAFSGSVAEHLLSLEMDVPIRAKSLYLRTVVFPLYPRLRPDAVSKITRVLATLP